MTMQRTGSANRTAALTLIAVAALILGGAPAQAADGVSIAGYQSAEQTLRSDQVRDTVSRFLVSARQNHSPEPAEHGARTNAENTPAAAAAPPEFDLKNPVPLFEISPEFVAGKTPASPQTALQLSYLASRVTASDGRHAAVLLAPLGATKGNGQNPGSQGWQLAGVRDGDTEISMAEHTTPQARSFTEPQIHAWYQLTSAGMVVPLNEEAKNSLSGRGSITLTSYQKLVASRYADKLPGSEYDRRGLAGGFDDQTTEQSSQIGSTSKQPTSGSVWRQLVAASLVALGAGAALHYVRRRQHIRPRPRL
ncbi:hypothetical protein ACFCYM_34325 [Streptomyces sp. NPDC056254]|uniref:hypothetical protein n=1 Tax=Streptomyces sp. NPDC056254 TaxID=3345763 RepID=UPI0035D6F5B3